MSTKLFSTASDVYCVDSVRDWDWNGLNPEQVENDLAIFIYRNQDDYVVENDYGDTEFDFNNALRDFIKLELEQNPADYGI